MALRTDGNSAAMWRRVGSMLGPQTRSLDPGNLAQTRGSGHSPKPAVQQCRRLSDHRIRAAGSGRTCAPLKGGAREVGSAL
jgi:hypothetical protein